MMAAGAEGKGGCAFVEIVAHGVGNLHWHSGMVAACVYNHWEESGSVETVCALYMDEHHGGGMTAPWRRGEFIEEFQAIATQGGLRPEPLRFGECPE